MRRGLVVLSFFLLACRPPAELPGDPPSDPPPAALSPVVSVLDGDTLDLSRSGTTVRVRLKGINTSEKGECMAAEATEALRQLVRGGVRLEDRGTDSYGRTLGYLRTADGLLVQEELTLRGLAIAYPYGDSDEYTALIAAAQQRARDEQRGVFAPSACGTASEARVEIVRADPNPPGKDTAFGAGESITLQGAPGLELGGWTIKDRSASHRLHLPAGTRLDEAGFLRIYTSCGPEREGVHHWCVKRSAVWNNGGDTAFLLDPAGNIVSMREWAP